MSAATFDLVVIGGGPAGTAGALAAAAFGKSAALVESSELLGGAGINTGTIPSKTLRESALLLSGWRARKLLGLDLALRHKARLADFTHHTHLVTAAERERICARLQSGGVERIHGQAKFLDAHTLAVTNDSGDVTRLSGGTILVATGSSPVRPPEFPFEHPRVHDSNEILAIEHMPKTLAVVGAGVIGAEYACTFAALGVEVHLIDGREQFLPVLDEDVRSALSQAMSAAGIRFHRPERVQRCEIRGPADVLLALSSGAELAVTDVLVCAGRCSNTAELDLPAAGIEPGERGLIPVDHHYRTRVPSIFAAGDVVGPPALAGTAQEQARVAVCRALHLVDKETSPILPTGIYTIPEVSLVGATEQSLKKEGVDYLVGKADYVQSPRGRIIGDEAGFLKLLFRREDLRLLGAQAIGEQASELVHIGLMALHCGAGAELFNEVCFNYPTLGELYKYATYDALLQRMGRRPIRC